MGYILSFRISRGMVGVMTYAKKVTRQRLGTITNSSEDSLTRRAPVVYGRVEYDSSQSHYQCEPNSFGGPEVFRQGLDS